MRSLDDVPKSTFDNFLNISYSTSCIPEIAE